MRRRGWNLGPAKLGEEEDKRAEGEMSEMREMREREDRIHGLVQHEKKKKKVAAKRRQDMTRIEVVMVGTFFYLDRLIHLSNSLWVKIRIH